MSDPPVFELDEIIAIDGQPGYFYWIIRLPIEGDDTYTLYGGRMMKKGACLASTRSVRLPALRKVKGAATIKKSIATRRVIEEALSAAPRPRGGRK